jgi:hypothetical protein
MHQTQERQTGVAPERISSRWQPAMVTLTAANARAAPGSHASAGLGSACSVGRPLRAHSIIRRRSSGAHGEDPELTSVQHRMIHSSGYDDH